MLGRALIWIALLLISALVHAIISWRVSDDIQALPPLAEEVEEIEITLRETPPPPPVVEPPPPEDKLDFEEPLELDPPEILIQPQAVTPPPPNVPLTLRASAGGVTGLKLAGRVAALPLGEGMGTAGFGRGIGNGFGDSTSRFAAYVAGLRNSGLDVMFVVDATGSMDWVIDEVKSRIDDITQMIRSLVPIARFGIVAFRDREDPEFVIKDQSLTYSTTKLRRFLSQLKAVGGGDQYEEVHLAVRAAIEDAGWRLGARQIIIVISDAPPRPGKLLNMTKRIEYFVSLGGTLSTLDVSDEANPALIEAKVGRKVNRNLYRNEPLYEFRVMADAGAGDAATLEGDTALTKRLMVLIIGEKFAREMQALIEII